MHAKDKFSMTGNRVSGGLEIFTMGGPYSDYIPVEFLELFIKRFRIDKAKTG
jgi:hypothetical protein